MSLSCRVNVIMSPDVTDRQTEEIESALLSEGKLLQSVPPERSHHPLEQVLSTMLCFFKKSEMILIVSLSENC